jgi:nucleoside-diphosphate kinase
MNAPAVEQSLVLIKPDALKNSLTGYVLSQLSEFHTGLRFAGAKIVSVHRMLAEAHYGEHRSKPFFPALIDYLMGASHYPVEVWRRRVIALVYSGPDAIARIRAIAGPTNPHKARDERPGCVRALGTVVPVRDAAGAVVGERMDNLIHASANPQDAEREIKLWFKPTDIPPGMRVYPTRVSQKLYFLRQQTLSSEYVPGSFCLVAPGDTVWASDLDVLERSSGQGQDPAAIATVAAKYLINEEQPAG